jgi:hypothetical protein
MNNRFLKPFAGIVLALCAGFAQAAVTPTVIDFTVPSNAFTYAEDHYGMVSLAPLKVSGGTLTTYGFLFASTSLAPFDLLSLDLGNTGNKKSGGSIDLFYTVAGSLHVYEETLKLDKLAGLQTFASQLGDLTDLTSFTLVGKSFLQFQVDNITVTPFKAAAAVPEPGSVALMFAGLAMLGTMVRRRKG